MLRESRERCPRHRLQRKPLVSNPGMHHGTCITHVPWCMSGSLTRVGKENVPGIPANAQPAFLRIWQEAHNTMAWKYAPYHWPFSVNYTRKRSVMRSLDGFIVISLKELLHKLSSRRWIGVKRDQITAPPFSWLWCIEYRVILEPELLRDLDVCNNMIYTCLDMIINYTLVCGICIVSLS